MNTPDASTDGGLLTIMPSGNVGVSNDNPQHKLDVNGKCKAQQFIGDGSLLTGIQVGGSVQLLHHHHTGTDSNFICKILCNGTFSTTQQHPLKSDTSIIALESGPAVDPAVKFPIVDGIQVYHLDHGLKF